MNNIPIYTQNSGAYTQHTFLPSSLSPRIRTQPYLPERAFSFFARLFLILRVLPSRMERRNALIYNLYTYTYTHTTRKEATIPSLDYSHSPPPPIPSPNARNVHEPFCSLFISQKVKRSVEKQEAPKTQTNRSHHTTINILSLFYLLPSFWVFPFSRANILSFLYKKEKQKKTRVQSSRQWTSDEFPLTHLLPPQRKVVPLRKRAYKTKGKSNQVSTLFSWLVSHS